MSRHTVRPGTVQETLLIPLYGRAVETRKDQPALRDPRAEELVAAIDYDFARFDGLPSLLGSVLRTCLFDHWARTFLEEHPDGTVVELGAGLNTRFERVDNGRARWVDLDLPDVAALRREFFPDTDRRHLVAASVTDRTWAGAVADFGQGAYLFCAEAVLPYLDEHEVRAVHDLIAERFPGSRLALDTASPHVVATQDTHDALSKVTARMRWACPDPRQLADWTAGAELLASHTLTTLPGPVHDALPAPYRATIRELAQQRLPGVEEYSLNLLQLP
ncbi:class I SAM-dependent methyltransferase [Streptomyces reniochalinae]|uniref:Class I SAM-dependent methyltransferase n=1 Tax=Streptomyces reniochalinae TaxID=2250578 RepID=A0A367EVP7_9ACTN|nr:class I SAM-dependent methyltransferase [Streptomyces reniochalinae]RCG22208.1 class I SAM-dependent methyltransferase [Streptomyces reniochalinae]